MGSWLRVLMATGLGAAVGIAIIDWGGFTDFRKVLTCALIGVLAAVAFAPRD